MAGRLVVLACVATAVLAAAPAASAAGPLRTAIVDPVRFGPNNPVAFEQTRNAGATMARLMLQWRAVAARRPASATDPNDPAYDWRSFDREVALALANGLEPAVTIMFAPGWAEGRGAGLDGTVRPDPVAFGEFARAAARRYDGDPIYLDPDDPYSEPVRLRVRYWQAWNEPNRKYFLMPQRQGGRLVAAERYRNMVNQFSAAVHAVDPTNVVVAGGLAPFARPGSPAPLTFMRAMLCMSPPPHRPTCRARTSFDVWSHHPYTSGGPTRRALRRDDVALGDLPEMRRLLRAAERAGRVRSARRVDFWVTEFSWDSDPPDRWGVPSRLHARWVAEALYRMWGSGVHVVTWFLTEDRPLSESPWQAGLYRSNGRPKLALAAFRFPFVAFTRSRGVLVWGRTPWGQRDVVVVEQRVSTRWRRVATLGTNRYGIFSRVLRVPKRGSLRARLADGSYQAVPFSLRKPRECFVNAFGGGPPPLRPAC